MSSLGELPFAAVVTRHPDRVVLAVSGDVDLATADELGAAIDAALSENTRLVIDLRNTAFMDSTGLSRLIRAKRRLDAAGESLVVRTSPGAVRRVLAVSGLDRVLAVDPLDDEDDG